MSGRLVVAIAVVSICISAGGCTSPNAEGYQVPSPKIIESEARYHKEYLISPGDRLDIDVRGLQTSRLDQGVLVRPDGFISLPLLKDVKAAGLTFPQLDAKLTALFSQRLVNPEVTVIAKSVREPTVYVLGEVNTPRPVPLA